MIEWWQIGLLFLTGLTAGFVDTLAGGGGLLTLPVLLSICPNPIVAIATNKLQSSFGSTSATVHFARAGAISLKEVWRSCLLSFIGSICGSLLVSHFDTSLLKRLLPLLLISVAVFVWLKPALGEKDIHPRMSRMKFDFIFALGIGFYDGFLGPGTGTFLAMAFMLGLGFNMARATANAKALNCASNLGALGIFLLGGNIWFTAGLVMGAGQWLGAQIGGHMVIKRGTKFIRPVFLTMVLLITLKLIYDNYFKAHA